MLSFLVLLMLVLAFSQPSNERKIVVIVFSVEKVLSQFSFLSFEFLFFRPVGGSYYMPMAVLDFITILVLSNLLYIPKITIELQRICLVSIFANFMGWVCWELYIKHAMIYNTFYTLLYIFTIFIIIKKDRKNDRDHRLDLWAGHLRFNNN